MHNDIRKTTTSAIAENRRSLIECIIIAILLMQATGYGVESRSAQISVVLVAIAAYLANEFYGRKFDQLADLWESFVAVSNRRRRMSYAAVTFATSLYIYIQINFRTADMLAEMALSVGLVFGGLWLLIEAVSMTMDPRYVQVDLGIPELPERFPLGNVFANLRALAGAEATDRDLLSVAREFSADEQWLNLCRHLIAQNLPDSGIAAELIGQPNVFAFADANFGYEESNEHTKLYDRLLKETGEERPTETQLMEAAARLSLQPVFIDRAADAVRHVHRRVRL